MMKKIKKYMVAPLTGLILVAILSGCSERRNDEKINQDNNNIESSEGEKDTLRGVISIAGSTSMEKLANASAEAFMKKYSDVIVTAEFVGSSAGVEQVISGTVMIGNASRRLKNSEQDSGAVENIVAIDGIAVILDNNNVITDLTKDQLVDIYTGKIRYWNEIGGEKQPIVVVGRESGSGTRAAFEEILGVEEKCKYSNEINSTGGVMAKVASIPGAIGYVSIDIIDDTVKPAGLEGFLPTEENIRNGKYLLSRPFVMATNGEISIQSIEVQTFFNFLKSENGRQLIQDVGLITVD